MKISFRKKILLMIILLLLSSGLFYLNLNSESKEKHKNPDQIIVIDFNEEQQSVISNEIDEILHSFGLDNSWIKNNEDQELWFKKEIMLPKDIVAPEILVEVTNYLKRFNLHDKVYEDPKLKNITYEIFRAMDTSLIKVSEIKFVFSDNIRRNNKSIALILDNVVSYKLDDISKILNSVQRYSVIMPMSNEKSDYESLINEYNKDFVLKFIIGNDNELSADFRTDMPERTWRSKVKTTSLTYHKTSGVILFPGPDTYPVAGEINSEFQKNNLKVYLDTLFIVFESKEKGEKKVKELLNDIRLKSSNRDFLFYIADLSPEEFFIFDKEIYDLKKKGFRFFDFRNAIRRMEKIIETENIIP
jgi:hypothetical protein